mgnify:CR=1 FL=1
MRLPEREYDCKSEAMKHYPFERLSKNSAFVLVLESNGEKIGLRSARVKRKRFLESDTSSGLSQKEIEYLRFPENFEVEYRSSQTPYKKQIAFFESRNQDSRTGGIQSYRKL